MNPSINLVDEKWRPSTDVPSITEPYRSLVLLCDRLPTWHEVQASLSWPNVWKIYCHLSSLPCPAPDYVDILATVGLCVSSFVMSTALLPFAGALGFSESSGLGSIYQFLGMHWPHWMTEGAFETILTSAWAFSGFLLIIALQKGYGFFVGLTKIVALSLVVGIILRVARLEWLLVLLPNFVGGWEFASLIVRLIRLRRTSRLRDAVFLV